MKQLLYSIFFINLLYASDNTIEIFKKTCREHNKPSANALLSFGLSTEELVTTDESGDPLFLYYLFAFGSQQLPKLNTEEENRQFMKHCDYLLPKVLNYEQLFKNPTYQPSNANKTYQHRLLLPILLGTSPGFLKTNEKAVMNNLKNFLSTEKDITQQPTSILSSLDANRIQSIALYLIARSQGITRTWRHEKIIEYGCEKCLFMIPDMERLFGSNKQTVQASFVEYWVKSFYVSFPIANKALAAKNVPVPSKEEAKGFFNLLYAPENTDHSHND